MLENTLTKCEIEYLFDYKDGVLYWKHGRANVVAGSPAGSPIPKGYIQIQIDNKMYKAHVLIWILFMGEIPTGFIIDHHDRDKSNNKFENLRLATLSQNSYNSKKRAGTSSKYKGVHWNTQSNSWRASIRVNGKAKYIGNFKDEYEAHLAWRKVARELHGEFFNPS